jgi:hypothetical protein
MLQALEKHLEHPQSFGCIRKVHVHFPFLLSKLWRYYQVDWLQSGS